MPCYICETCGTQHAATSEPPKHCSICEDDRQYVGWRGQTWTTHAALSERCSLRIEDDEGLLGIGIRGEFAIPQRALLLATSAGNVLWECVSLVTDQALSELKARGGVNQIVISHPHFYSSMVEERCARGGADSAACSGSRLGPAFVETRGLLERRCSSALQRGDAHPRGWPFPWQHSAALAGVPSCRAVFRRCVASRNGSSARGVHVQLSQLCAHENQRGACHARATQWIRL